MRNLEYLYYGISLGIIVNVLISFGLVNIGWETQEGGWRFQGTTVKSNILANIAIVTTFFSIYYIHLILHFRLLLLLEFHLKSVLIFQA